MTKLCKVISFLLLALMNGGRGAVAHPDCQYCFVRIWQPEARYVTCNDNKTFVPAVRSVTPNILDIQYIWHY